MTFVKKGRYFIIALWILGLRPAHTHKATSKKSARVQQTRLPACLPVGVFGPRPPKHRRHWGNLSRGKPHQSDVNELPRAKRLTCLQSPTPTGARKCANFQTWPVDTHEHTRTQGAEAEAKVKEYFPQYLTRGTSVVLVSSVNKSVVNLINKTGARAVGLSGKDGMLLEARKLAMTISHGEQQPPEIIDLGNVGEVTKVNVQLLTSLIHDDFVPVIAPVGVDEEGNTYNINADSVAGAVAGALKARRLLMPKKSFRAEYDRLADLGSLRFSALAVLFNVPLDEVMCRAHDLRLA